MKIIVNADDFGMTSSVNRAILEMMDVGSVTSTTVMVNMPYAEEVSELLKRPKVSIGLHFNLTQGPCMADQAKVTGLVDEKGMFLGKTELLRRISAGKITGDQVLAELQAQYDWLFSRIGKRLDHFDSHQGLNKIGVVSDAVLKFGKLNKIPAIRIYSKYYIRKSGNSAKVLFPGIFSFPAFSPKRIAVETFLKFRVLLMSKYYKHPKGLLVSNSHNAIDVFKLLAQYPEASFPNITVEVPCHPAADLSELENTKLMNERVAEYEFLTSDEFKAILPKLNLVNYQQL